MRRGQSSAEPLLVVTGLLLVVWLVAEWRFDALYAWLIGVAGVLEQQEWFQRILGWLGSFG